jgi:hypothetical protein
MKDSLLFRVIFVEKNNFCLEQTAKMLQSIIFFLDVVLRGTRRRRKLSGGAFSTEIQTKTAGELIVFITDGPPCSEGCKRHVTKRRPEFI